MAKLKMVNHYYLLVCTKTPLFSRIVGYIKNLKKFLKKHPDDLAVQCNLDSLQARYDEHLIELTFKKNISIYLD